MAPISRTLASLCLFLSTTLQLIIANKDFGLSQYPSSVDSIASETINVDKITLELVQWLIKSGATINEKVEIRPIDPNDPKSPRGLFSMQDMDEGESIVHIPWHLIVKSPTSQKGMSDSDCGVIDEIYTVMSANEEEMTPYGRYLLLQPHNYTLSFWSSQGQDLFEKMTNNILPPHDIDDILDDWVSECQGDVSNVLHVQAAMLVKARADWEYMVPFYDMINHHNAKLNTQHKYDIYNVFLNETGHELIASRKILSGEQLYGSYNHCKTVCNHYYDWFGTPEMFLHYGFVEMYPQRWLFDFARVKFDLVEEKESGGSGVRVNFLVPPSERGLKLLREQLDLLDAFAVDNRDNEKFKNIIRESEWNSLWNYYDAMYNALKLATESNGTLVDDVWKMGDNWWVKDGGITAEQEGEHCVRATLSDEL